MPFNPTCFVILPLDRNDIEVVFSNLIDPSVRACGLEPRRVDRTEGAESIDNRILKLIDESSIVIADLTYERPNCYFEAGYAVAKENKQVIFTARKDHDPRRPGRGSNDPKVHFDLDSHKITYWNASQPSAKRSELEERIKRAIKVVSDQSKNETVTTDVVQPSDLGGEIFLSEYATFYRRAAARWKAEKDSQPINLDEGKVALGEMQEALLELRSRPYTEVDSTVAQQLDEALGKISTLLKHRLRANAGGSYYSFWSLGDDLIHSLLWIRDHLQKGLHSISNTAMAITPPPQVFPILDYGDYERIFIIDRRQKLGDSAKVYYEPSGMGMPVYLRNIGEEDAFKIKGLFGSNFLPATEFMLHSLPGGRSVSPRASPAACGIFAALPAGVECPGAHLAAGAL